MPDQKDPFQPVDFTGTGHDPNHDNERRFADNPDLQASHDDLLQRLFADPTQYAADKFHASGFAQTIGGGRSGVLTDQEIRARQNAPARANPYDLGLGNQARDGYLAALDQLHNGTSVVGGQANQAMGQLGQQVGNATANTSSGLAQMMATRAGAQGASDVADQSGNARLNEFMGQQSEYGQGLGNLRGQDLQQAASFQDAGLRQRGQDDGLSEFYRHLGMKTTDAKEKLSLSTYQLIQRMRRDKDKGNWDNAKTSAQTAATVIGAM